MHQPIKDLANGSKWQHICEVHTIPLRFVSMKYEWSFTVADVSSLARSLFPMCKFPPGGPQRQVLSKCGDLSVSPFTTSSFCPSLLCYFNLLISTIYCSRIFKILRFLSFSNPPQNIAWNTSFQFKVHWYMHMPAICLLTSSHWLRKNLLVWKPWVLLSAHPVYGHCHSYGSQSIWQMVSLWRLQTPQLCYFT